MANAELRGVQVTEIHFFNKIRPKGNQLQLVSGFSFNVTYAADGKQAVATLYQSLKDNVDGETFFCSVEMRGVFALSGTVDEAAKRDLHALCYDQMFPYIQRQVKDLCASSGIPNMMLRKSKINPENIAFRKGGAGGEAAEPRPTQLPIV